MLRALMILAAPSGLAATAALLFGASWHIVAVAYVMVGMSSSAILAMIMAVCPNKLETAGHIEAETERDILALQARHIPSLSDLEAEYIAGRDAVRLRLRSALATRPTLESGPCAAGDETGEHVNEADVDLSRRTEIASRRIAHDRHAE